MIDKNSPIPVYYQLKNENVDEKFVDDIYEQDLIFSDIDYRIYK